MKKSLLLLILALLFIKPIISFAQFTLTIEISGLRSDNGQILLQVYDEKHCKVKGVIGNVKDGKSELIIENLEPKKYAFRYFHDENMNNKMDNNWIGLPNEGYGFSNDANGFFGPPSFDKWIFELKENTKMNCKINY